MSKFEPKIPEKSQKEKQEIFNRKQWLALSVCLLGVNAEMAGVEDNDDYPVSAMRKAVEEQPDVIKSIEFVRGIFEVPDVEMIQAECDNVADLIYGEFELDDDCVVSSSTVKEYFANITGHDPYTGLHIMSVFQKIFDLHQQIWETESGGDTLPKIELSPNDLLLVGLTHDIGKFSMFEEGAIGFQKEHSSLDQSDKDAIIRSLFIKAAFDKPTTPPVRQEIVSKHLTKLGPDELIDELNRQFRKEGDKQFFDELSLQYRLMVAASACHHFEVDENNQVQNSEDKPSYGHKSFQLLYQGALDGIDEFRQALLSTNFNNFFDQSSAENIQDAELEKLREKFLYAVRLGIVVDLTSALSEKRPYEKREQPMKNKCKVAREIVQTAMNFEYSSELTQITDDMFAQNWHYVRDLKQRIEESKKSYKYELKAEDITQIKVFVQACKNGKKMLDSYGEVLKSKYETLEMKRNTSGLPLSNQHLEILREMQKQARLLKQAGGDLDPIILFLEQQCS